MQRFCVSFPLLPEIKITDMEMYHQLTRVLRVKRGEKIILFTGDGSETEYEIGEIEKKFLLLIKGNQSYPLTENQKGITLFQALPNKIEKIEYILQKGVEVGIRRFVFFRSDFSQKLILSPNKKERFSHIAREALEQCGGVIVPEIEFFEEPPYETTSKTSLQIVLDTTGIALKLTEIPQNQEIGLWVGPEGGWSENERNKMKENGFIFARFGERILRTETAGVVTAFALLHL